LRVHDLQREVLGRQRGEQLLPIVGAHPPSLAIKLAVSHSLRHSRRPRQAGSGSFAVRRLS
jgi:hypothetical protein